MNAGKIEALKWCEKYLKKWPKEEDLSKVARPLGWSWGVTPHNDIYLRCGDNVLIEKEVRLNVQIN